MSKLLKLVIIIFCIYCFIPQFICAQNNRDYQRAQKQIYKYWFTRKKRIRQASNKEKDLFTFDELEQIIRIKTEYKLGNLSIFATLLIREAQSAIEDQNYALAEKLIDYAYTLAPTLPLVYYAKGYLNLSKNWMAIHKYPKYYIMGAIKSFNHPQSLFVLIYKNLLIILFCSVFCYLLITVSLFFKYIPCYLLELMEKFNKSKKAIVEFLLMIFLLIIPFVFNFSFPWLLLYFLFLLFPYLKLKGKISVIIIFFILMFLEPFIFTSLKTFIPSNLEHYDFPSILIYEEEMETGFNKIDNMTDLNQQKIILNIFSDIKETLKKNSMKSFILKPISDKYKNMIFSPLIFLFFLFFLIILRLKPLINRCSVCQAKINKLDLSVSEELLCNNCSLLHNKADKNVEKNIRQILESDFMFHHNIIKIISYFLPGFFSFFETEGIFNLLFLYIWGFFLLKFYISLKNILSGRFLVLNKWPIIFIWYVPLLIIIYLIGKYRDNKVIKDKEDKINLFLD